MKDPSRRYWFPAKRYGWGWGLPSTWEGWLVMGGYLGAILMGTGILVRDQSLIGWYIAGTFVLTATLIVVCWFKGEPPKWRWGEDD